MTREELEKLYYDFIDEYTNTYTCESGYVDLKKYRNACIRYGFEKGRELVDDGLKDAPIEMQIIFKKISEQAAKDILEGLKYESAEEVIKELDEEQDDK